MILPLPKDALHKSWLYRTLTALLNDPVVASKMYFKGGTCAAMIGWLDRFSFDLDFDFMGSTDDMDDIRKRCEDIFLKHELTIDDSSKNGIQFFLKYPAPRNERNTLKIDTGFPPTKANIYERIRLIEIDRIAICQTRETSFANKLVACADRRASNRPLAGRDVYDIHRFFLQGFRYNEAVIKERHNGNILDFFSTLAKKIESRVTQVTIDQDLNRLLTLAHFGAIRKHLKQETLMFIRDEIARLSQQ